MPSGGQTDESGSMLPAATVLRLVGERTAGMTGDPSAVLLGLCEAIREGFGLDRAFGFRFLARSEELTPVAVPGSHEEDVLSTRWLSLTDWPALVRAMAAKKATLAGGVSGPALPAEAASELDVGELVVVPVGVAGKFTRFVVADTRSRTLELSEEQLELLSAVGAVGGILIEAACQQEHARRLSDLKSHFITLASHELRAPFAVMHGVITTLQHRAGTLPEKQLACLRNGLYEQSERTGRLLEQLLDLSRLDTKAIPIERSRFSIRPRVKELVETVVGERKAEFEIDVPPTWWLTRIRMRSTASSRTSSSTPFAMDALRSRSYRGGGVAREFVPRLFDRFSRGDEAAGDGSGLGLSIAKSYAQAHGGELVYRSAHPHGARFELVLPRPHADEPNESSSAS